MSVLAGLIVLIAIHQVPPPDTGASESRKLQAEAEKILTVERKTLEAIAARLVRENREKDAAAIRSLIEPEKVSGAIRFRPLAEVVSAQAEGLARMPVGSAARHPEDAISVRLETAKQLFAIAVRAASPEVRRFALADRLLRGVLGRDPNHAESRRLLGFIPYKGGWATPHAADLLGKGYVLHPKFGWVQKDWVAHLDRGELPGVMLSNGKPREWLPADQANALRGDWAKGWIVKTAPHFEIQTNVPLDEAVAFAQRLEGFHQLFFSQFADVIGAEYLPLADRFRNPSKKPVVPSKQFLVAYFAEKDEYVDYFRQKFHLDETLSLGFYMPLAEARLLKIKPRSYFYRDPTNPIGSHATLYHEASHQLLFESVKPGFNENRPGFWVWEGLGTYFETLTVESDGSLLVGGFVGPRLESARDLSAQPGKLIPIAELCAMDKEEFLSKAGDAVYRNYAQSIALTAFLLNGEDGRHREAFLDFVADAYRGRAKAESLADRLGVPFKTLDASLKEYLKAQ